MSCSYSPEHAGYRESQIDQLFEQTIDYLNGQSYLAQLIDSYRGSIMDAEATALLRFQLVLQGIWQAGALEKDQFEHLAGMIFTGQAEGWLI